MEHEVAHGGADRGEAGDLVVATLSASCGDSPVLTKFGGAAMADQGTYNAAHEVGDDGPTFRGFQMGPGVDESEMYVEDDEMPVYRSIGMPAADSAPAAAPPAFCRQRACLNLLEPSNDPLAL